MNEEEIDIICVGNRPTSAKSFKSGPRPEEAAAHLLIAHGDDQEEPALLRAPHLQGRTVQAPGGPRWAVLKQISNSSNVPGQALRQRGGWGTWHTQHPTTSGKKHDGPELEHTKKLPKSVSSKATTSPCPAQQWRARPPQKELERQEGLGQEASRPARKLSSCQEIWSPEKGSFWHLLISEPTPQAC